MGNYNSNRSDRGSDNRGRSSEGPQMHQAQCSKCGKSCLVPFKPTGNRPIFCSDCFKTEGVQQIRRSDTRDSAPGDRKMYDAICDSCGNRCQIPFQPKSGKPVYCSHCFEQREKDGKGFRERPQAQNADLTAVNAKLDSILEILKGLQVVSPTPELESVEALLSEEVVKPTKTKKKTSTKKKAAKKKAA